MREKKIKYRKVAESTEKHIKNLAGEDDCKREFLLWAASARLDVTGIHWTNGYPIFRPAIVAWEAWQTAWNFQKPRKTTGAA